MKRFALVFMLFLLFVGISHADLITDGSFESSMIYTGQKCFIANGLLDLGDCKLSGDDRPFNVPEYWSMNNSIGDYARIISNSNCYVTSDNVIHCLYNDGNSKESCYARNVFAYLNVTSGLTIYETCDPSYRSYTKLSILDELPYPYANPTVLTGTKALEVHNIPTLPCGYSDGTNCGQRNSSAYGFVYQNVTLPDENYKLSFDVRSCDYTPPQCEESWCVISSFGNPREASLGNFRIIIANDTTFSNLYLDETGIADYRTGWHHYEYDLSGMEKSGNMTIGLGIDPVSESSSVCVIYDNVTLTAVTPVVVPSTNYINDMKTYIGFPITYSSHNPSSGISLSSASSITSIGYDGVTMMNTSYILPTGDYWTTACVIGACTDAYTVTLHYKNGRSITLGTASEDHKLACDIDGSGWVTAFYLYFEHSVPDPENIDYIDYYFLIQKYNGGCQSGTRSIYTNITFDQDITAREKYSNILEGETSDDILTGVPYLFPVLIYNNYINSSGCQFWTSYNFKTVAEAYTNNVEYTLYSGSGSPKQWGAESVSFAIRNSNHSYCWLDMTGVSDTDYIVTTVSSDFFSLSGITNMTARFPVTASGINLCVSRCDGTTRLVKTLLDSGACQIETIYNSSLCISIDGGFVPPASGNWSWWTNLTESIGNASDTFFGTADINFPAFLKFLIAIIITLIVPLLFAMQVGKYSKGEHGGIVYITTFLAVSLFFTLWGYPNGWLPSIFLIIDVIIFMLLIGVYGRKAITGG